MRYRLPYWAANPNQNPLLTKENTIGSADGEW